MLTDPQIERYSRQILLPEVGGHGQRRLLAARVTVTGTDAAAETAALLLGRAGVGTLVVPAALSRLDVGPDCRLVPGPAVADALISLDPGGPVPGGRGPIVLGALAPVAHVVALTGRPCAACVGPLLPALAGPAADPIAALALALALGALAAAEALRLLLVPPAGGRITVLAEGRPVATELGPTGGCAACGQAA